MNADRAMTRAGAEAAQTTQSVRWAIGLPVLRVALVAAASALTWLIVSASESGIAFPPSPMLAVIAMLPVNIICLWLVARLLYRQGRTIRELLGFEPRRLLRDLLWGLLWVTVLYLPFTGAILLVTWLQHGDELFTRMETVFFDPAGIPTLNPVAWAVLGIIGALTFAPLNAPVEELVYRGLAQGTLQRRWPTALAIVVPSHGLVNLFFTLPALAVPFIPADLMTNGA